ncbi:MAG: V-type ATP synthase subunit E [Oscillospiraceae bacterium]
MNGIEKITARIIADAQAEADVIKAEAAAKCEEIRGEYDKKAQEEYWRIVRSGVKECEARVQRLSRAAEMEAKKSVLTLKQDMVSAAFAQASEKVCAMPENDYVAFLAGLAAKAADTGHEEIILSSRDAALGDKVAKAANALLGAKGALKVSSVTRDMAGGLILRQGDIEINCNLETIIDQYRYELASQVAEVMFG